MPLIVLFLLLLAAVFLLDNRIIFRILFVVVNLWLTVMYFVIAEIQTAKLPQVPWFDPAGVSGTVVVYLALLMTAAGVLLFFLSRLLFVSRLPAVFPFIGAALLGIGLLPAGSQSAAHAAGGAALILLLLHIVFAEFVFQRVPGGRKRTAFELQTLKQFRLISFPRHQSGKYDPAAAIENSRMIDVF